MTDSGSEDQAEDGTWDVEKYRVDYESEEHWDLRKLSINMTAVSKKYLFSILQTFMEAHRDKFEEDEIVCLARVFTNVEFLGCRF